MITEPKRWESASFYYTGSLAPDGGGTSEGLVFDLLSQAHFDNFSADLEVRSLADALRTCQIGGVVWEFHGLALANGNAAGVFCPIQELLWTDRLDPAGGPAAGLATDWWQTQAPIDPAGLTDGDYPIRIHARRGASIFFPGTGSFSGSACIDTRVAAAPLQPRGWATRSVRLRGGLGDRQGLFLQHTLQAPTANIQLTYGVSGTLYYRARM